MDLLLGKHSESAAKWLGLAFQPDRQALWSLHRDGSVRIWDTAGKAVKPAEALVVPSPMQGSVGEKIRKALDMPFNAGAVFKAGAGKQKVSGQKVVALLRELCVGINIVYEDNRNQERVYPFTEPIPLGAFFQWAEDEFGWHFIIREYGIVVTTGDQLPPGAVLLVGDFWRKGAAATK